MKNRLLILLLFLSGSTFLAHGQQIIVKAGNLTNGLGTIVGFTDYAPLSSFQVGIKSDASWTNGGGGSATPANPLEVQFTKYSDGLSNRLNLAIAKGTSIPLMEILWLAESGKGMLSVAHKVELEDVYITEVMNSSVQECASCFVLAESYKAVYKSIKRTIYRQDKDGRFTRVSTFTWDVAENISQIE